MGFLKVRQLAEAQGLNITTFSRKAEIAYGTAHSLWHDKMELLGRGTLIRVSRALGVKVSDLFDENASDEELKE
jgi:hypothetical protein